MISSHELVKAAHIGKLSPRFHLIGVLAAGYEEMEKAFGKPNCVVIKPGEETDVEWFMTDTDGTRLNIYNYKCGLNWTGDGSKTPDRWHVAGFNDETFWELKGLVSNAN